MRKLSLLLALFLLAGSVSATTLTGTVINQSSSAQPGYLTFNLYCPPTGTCPVNIRQGEVVITLTSGGAVPGGASVEGNDVIALGGTWYRMDILDTHLNSLSFQYVVIRGATEDISHLAIYDPPPQTQLYKYGESDPFTPVILGFTPSSGGGLVLNVGVGDSFCGSPPGLNQYAGGSLTLTGSSANYVYLDYTTCAPAFNTTGFVAPAIPIAVVTTTTAITEIDDARTWFNTSLGTGGGGGGSSNPNFSTLVSGTNNVAAMVVGAGASLNYASTGTVNASSLEGNTWAAPGTIGGATPGIGYFTALNASGVFTSNITGFTQCIHAISSGAFQGTGSDCGNAFSNGVGAGYQDVTGISPPGNPASGNYRVYANSGTQQITCLTSSGTSCMPSGGGAPAGSTYAAQYNAGAGEFGGTNVPATKGQFMVGYTLPTDAAVAPAASQIGITGRAVTGTTANDTILFSDANKSVIYEGSVSVIPVTLPTATTLENTGFVVALWNQTTGTNTILRITPTTWTIMGGATLDVAQGQSCTVLRDPNSSTNWVTKCSEPALIAGTGVTFTRSASGLTIAASGSSSGPANTTTAVGTTTINANTCTGTTAVTMTGLTTSMTIDFTPTTDVSGVTGWGATGGLTIDAWPSATNTASYKVCNQTGSNITPGGSVTFNVSAR